MIRSLILFFLLAVTGLFIQATSVHSLIPAAIAPDFITILVVILALLHRSVFSMTLAFCLGVLADFASAQFLGPNAGGAVVAFLLVVFLSNKVYADRPFAVVFVAFFASLAKSVFSLLMLGIYVAQIETSELLLAWSTIRVIFWEAFITCLFAPLVLKLVRWFEKPGRLFTRKQEVSPMFLGARK